MFKNEVDQIPQICSNGDEFGGWVIDTAIMVGV